MKKIMMVVVFMMFGTALHAQGELTGFAADPYSFDKYPPCPSVASGLERTNCISRFFVYDLAQPEIDVAELIPGPTWTGSVALEIPLTGVRINLGNRKYEAKTEAITLEGDIVLSTVSNLVEHRNLPAAMGNAKAVEQTGL